MIINVSEKPFKLLKLFQTSRYNLHQSKPSKLNLFLDKNDLFHRIRIKAKYYYKKNSMYKTNIIFIVTLTEKKENFSLEISKSVLK